MHAAADLSLLLQETERDSSAGQSELSFSDIYQQDGLAGFWQAESHMSIFLPFLSVPLPLACVMLPPGSAVLQPDILPPLFSDIMQPAIGLILPPPVSALLPPTCAPPSLAGAVLQPACILPPPVSALLLPTCARPSLASALLPPACILPPPFSALLLPTCAPPSLAGAVLQPACIWLPPAGTPGLPAPLLPACFQLPTMNVMHPLFHIQGLFGLHCCHWAGGYGYAVVPMSSAIKLCGPAQWDFL